MVHIRGFFFLRHGNRAPLFGMIATLHPFIFNDICNISVFFRGMFVMLLLFRYC
ncbi:MAG: hypothetical protein ACNA78_00980 [Balneolaceae bacterium]